MGLPLKQEKYGGERRAHQQSTSGPAQHTGNKATRAAPALATPTGGASGYKTASKAVVAGTEPAAPAASTQTDDDYVYICVPRAKVAPVDTGRTETVKQSISQRPGPQKFAPVLQSVPLQLPAPPSQQWFGDSSTISILRVLVLQPGGFGDTNVNTVDTEPHLEALTRHVAGRLAVPDASVAAEVNVLMDSGSGITAMSEELVEVLRRQPGMMQTALMHAFVGLARMETSLGQECHIVTKSFPLYLTIETIWGPVRFTMPFILLPGEGDVVIIGQKTSIET